MSSDGEGQDFEAPLLFGYLEVVCFVFLFCSPYLPGDIVQDTWWLLVLWRTATLGGLFYYLRPPGFGLSLRGTLARHFSLFGRSLLYGIPFWVSSYCFSLRPGQTESIGKASLLFLLLSCLVFLMSFLPTHWFPAYLGVATFLYLLKSPLSWKEYLVLGVTCLLVVLPRAETGGRVQASLLGFLIVLGTSGWGICLFVDSAGESIGLSPLSRSLLAWFLLAGAAITVLGSARVDKNRRLLAREVECSLPCLEAGLTWFYSQKLRTGWGPWLVILPLSLWAERGLWSLCLAVVLAVPGLLFLAQRGGEQVHVQWWCSAQFVILWAMAETHGWSRLAWLLMSGLLSYVLYRTRPSVIGSQDPDMTPDSVRALEARLALELKVTAPADLAGRILEQSEPSVDFDDSLSSAAPSGFRQRLLERLRHRDTEDSSEDEPDLS